MELKAAHRAVRDAGSAAYAFAVINRSEVVFDGYSANRAVLLALHAADAAVATLLADEGAFFVVGADDSGLTGLRDKGDEPVGALLGAKTAADAASRVNVSKTVFNTDGVCGADLCAVAAAEAAGAAGALAAIEHFCRRAGVYAGILGFYSVVGAVAAAVYEGDHGSNLGGFNAEDSGNLTRNLCAAGAAEVGLGAVFGDGFGVSVTAGEAAGAAVGAGEAVTDGGFLFVYLGAHYGGGKNEKEGGNKTNSRNDKSGVKNYVQHIFFSSLGEKSFDNAAESVERNGDDRSGDEGDRNAFEAFGSVGFLKTASYAGKEHHCEKEAKTAAKRADHGLEERVLVGDVVDGNAENRAVGGDKGKIYAEGFVKARNVFLESYLNELYEGGDYENEHDGL